MDQYYQGKVAVVTGAAGVICSEVAKDLASLGCAVALVDLSLENAEKVAEAIRANGGSCKVYACNVMDQAAVNALADEIVKDVIEIPLQGHFKLGHGYLSSIRRCWDSLWERSS